MSNYDDRLKDYVDVKERIRLFYGQHPDGRLVTGEVSLTNEPDGVPRVMVQAFAYRDKDDGHPGVGHSWLALPGTTPYTRGSEVENAETSAWGRAIAALGIGIDKSIASANEVANKEEPTLASVNAKERQRIAASSVSGRPLDKESRYLANGDGSLIGTAELAKDFPDFLPKQSPDGMVLAFKLTSEAGGIKVIAKGPLAEVLPTIRAEVIGQRISCWGRVRDETFTPKGTKKVITFQVLDLERIKTDSGIMPANHIMDVGPEPSDDVPLLDEAPSEPLGLVS